MSTAGIQVWDSTGNLIFDSSTPVMKWLGKLSVGQDYTGTAQSGSLLVPEFGIYTKNKPFIARMDGAMATNSNQQEATFWVEGNYIHWQFPLADPGSYTSGGKTYYLNRNNQTVAYGLN